MARCLLALAFLITLSSPLVGQVADTTGRVQESGVRARFPERLEGLREPEVLQVPWHGAPRVPVGVRMMEFDSALAGTLDSARVERLKGLRNRQIFGTAPEGPGEEAPREPRRLLGLDKRYADLGLEGLVRLEIRTDRLKNERCTAIQLLDPGSGCRGSFRAPRLDNHVSLRSGGLIGQRIHLNIDYDNDRDFDANNDLQVYYEGLEDEIVRRVEVGTVTFLPPRSRFITSAVPTNNFGVNARFDVGPMQFQTLAATQKGSQVAERTYTVGQTTSQAQDRQVRDIDFESGRFFWVADPTGLPNYPAIDILNLGNVSVPDNVRPAQVRVYRFRPFTGPNRSNPNIGGITATARTIDPGQSYGPVQWELLIQNVDYYLDPSGMWFGLATKLDQDSYLAVSYITADGTPVGSFPAADQGPGSTDSLRLIVQPRAGPERVTFRHEMRQIYRVAGTDLDQGSLDVSIALNRSERPLSGAETYLALLGLSIPTDATILDRDNRLFPRSRDPEALQVVRESYIVFPHLTPFADPTRLTEAERADTIYRTPLYLLLQQAASKFTTRLRYNSTGAGDRSTLNLGQLQIREGSEQLTVRGRRLERNVDYTIAYDVGQVTFTNPETLFGEGAVQVNARYEVQEFFAVAPTTILGMSSSYSLGELGAVNLIGLYQSEQSAFNRPPLGFEASANLVGGVNTELHFKPAGLTRLLNSLMPRNSTAPSLLDVNAEFAFTKPDPNRSGQAYLEEFESDAGVQVSLGENVWEFGSIPQSAAGVEDIGFAAGFDPEDAVALTWQNLIQSGNNAVEIRPEDIDTLIRITRSADQRVTALWMTLHADTAGGIVRTNRSSRWTLPQRDGRPRWRSMVTSLSTTGLDLSTNEFLEFWVYQPITRATDAAGVRLVFDLGNVNEDALAIAPEGFTPDGGDTVYTGRRYVGLDRLDTERQSIGTFDAQVDDVGILSDRPDGLIDFSTGLLLDELPLCERTLQSAVPVFPWGDLSSRCTRGNGVLDTEDLNGDNGLNSGGPGENVFRFVVPLAQGSPYFVRNGQPVLDQSGQVIANWELYRVPVRRPDAVIGSPNLRSVQQLRLTVTGTADIGQPDVVASFALARLNFVGTSWIRRAETPIAGLSGSLGEPTGEVVATVVSTANRLDLGYESPPGVLESVSRRGDVGSSGVQINERSLRLVARELDVGDRAEAYLRFPAGPQNMLAYRQLRVWMRGRGPGWEEGELQAFVKVGSDDRNFYLYRALARSTTWDPEMRVDLEVWRRLRADVEQRWLSGAPPSGSDVCGTTDPSAYVACEDGYLVHVGDPGINPPNLAAAQELSAGIYRATGLGIMSEAELWVDDIRLANPLAETGSAIALDSRLIASDVGSVTASYVRQNGQFRFLNADPSYRTTQAVTVDSRWQLDRFLPGGLGISAPFSITHARTAVDPELLTGTDLRGSALAGLRRPSNRSTTFALAVRRSSKGTDWFTRSFLDPFQVSASLTQGRSGTEYSTARSNNYNVTLGYNIQMRRRGFRLPLDWLVGALPDFIRTSETGKGLQNPQVSLVPSTLRLSSGLTRDWAEQRNFGVPIVRGDDALVRPTLALNHLWRNAAGLTWQPLGLVTLSSDLISTRDLRVYPDSSPAGRLTYANRKFLFGVPVGVERDRSLNTALTSTPRLTSWLALRIVSASSFVLSRSLNTRDPVREEPDSGAFILPQTLNNQRSWETGFSLDLARAIRGLTSDSSGATRFTARIRPIEVRRQVRRASTFDLAAFDPSVGYMLGFGGLGRFLEQEGERAIGASVTRGTNVTSGADLPFGLTASLTYGLTSTDRYQRVSEGQVLTVTEQREWPSGQMRWSRVFRGGPLSVLAAGLTFREREGSSTQPGQAEGGVQSAIRSSSWRPDLQVGLRNGMNLSVSWNTLFQRTRNSSSVTILDQDDWSGSFSHSFRSPFRIGGRRRQMRPTLSLLLTQTRSCIERGSDDTCTTISDVRRQEVRGGVDTDVATALSAGLQVGYSVNDSRHLNQRTSQISLLASFQWSFDAGSTQ